MIRKVKPKCQGQGHAQGHISNIRKNLVYHLPFSFMSAKTSCLLAFQMSSYNMSCKFLHLKYLKVLLKAKLLRN